MEVMASGVVEEIDWALCIFCQSKTPEKLVVPTGTGYTSVGAHLEGFKVNGALPTSLKTGSLDDGSGYAATLSKQKAVWHANCRAKYNQRMLSRAEKRRHDDDNDGNDFGDSKKKTQSCRESSAKPAKQAKNASVITATNSATDPVVNMDQGNVFSEVVEHLERELSNQPHIVRLADVVSLYQSKMMEFGEGSEGRPHSTRLKEKLLAHIPGLTAHKTGHDVLLVKDTDIGYTLTKAMENTDTSEDFILAQAAKVLRSEMFKDSFVFDGTFPEDCQEKSVPLMLQSFISMLLEGPGITGKTTRTKTPACLSIAQLIKYNAVKRTRASDPTRYRHDRSKETPFPLYVGLLMHTHTRQAGLIDKLFDMGISVSYKRILNLSTDLSNAVCERFKEEGVVVPPGMHKSVFITGAVDNLDHNPSSTTARGSFHGTGISLFQHPDFEGQGEATATVNILSVKGTHHLPNYYTTVPQVTTPPKDVAVPEATRSLLPESVGPTGDGSINQQEYAWLHYLQRNSDVPPTKDLSLSWAAFHANEQHFVKPKCKGALLPLFEESAHSHAMIRHSMDVIRDATTYLNPDQEIPVMTCDQPLFAIAKSIQWTWPETYGEDKFIIVMGGFHIEQAAWSALGTWLEQSGWTEAICEAGIVGPATAKSLLNCGNLKRTRYAHEVTAGVLYLLQTEAYEGYLSRLSESQCRLTFTEWMGEKQKQHPHSLYWSHVLEMELSVLTFVRSIRTSNFELYIQSLEELLPWFFLLDHVHYARWLPVHLRDMKQLQTNAPKVATAFAAGKFTVQKTDKVFSSIALDHAHEQMNKIVKGEGGAVGLTENDAGFERWMTAGPEMARLVDEFEKTFHSAEDQDNRHHEQTEAHQKRFQTDLEALKKKMLYLGNPFAEESEDLLNLSTKDVANDAAVKAVKNAKDTGKTQYVRFVDERLQKRSKPISDAIHLNKLDLFKSQKKLARKGTDQKLKAAKSNVNLFSKLYIGCQVRGGDLQDFFEHENHAYPPSISDTGDLRTGNKADILQCLDRSHLPVLREPQAEAVVIDGAAVVHILKPGQAKTFQEYNDSVFLPYILTCLATAERVDIVWDTYREPSLKTSTRKARGTGIRRRVGGNISLPNNWQDFLKDQENKTELFAFLSYNVQLITVEGKTIIATQGDKIVSSCSSVLSQQQIDQLSPCSHEEADTRLFVHCMDIARNGNVKDILLRTVDTDVVVLAIAHYNLLQVEHLWVAFGSGNKFRFLPIHEYAAVMGPERATASLMFHAITGCDTVSFFYGVGKKTCWDVWMSDMEMTRLFHKLLSAPENLHDHFLQVQRFVVLMYDKTSPVQKVNDARKHMFTKKGRDIETVPPTAAALLQHTKRAVLQAVIWKEAVNPRPALPDPVNWGWSLVDDKYTPMWTTLPEASKVCREMVHCGCKKGCKGNCKCGGLQCTALCACDGRCEKSLKAASGSSRHPSVSGDNGLHSGHQEDQP